MQRAETRVCGYLASKKDKGIIVVMIAGVDGSKRYVIGDLNEALEVLTGKIAFCRLKEWKRRRG